VQLSELETDALTEVVNIGVSRAAANLGRMAGEEVILTVPAISTVTPEQAAEMAGGAKAGSLVSVRETFSGEISGRALLVFPAGSSLELVRAVTRDELGGDELLDAADEALLETGNVVLQACLSSMANLLKRTLEISTPELVRGTAAELFSGAATVVLFIYINFNLRGRRVRGYVVLAMDLPSQARLKDLLAELIARETEGED
jgi:chemotaxis protein CheC